MSFENGSMMKKGASTKEEVENIVPTQSKDAVETKQDREESPDSALFKKSEKRGGAKEEKTEIPDKKIKAAAKKNGAKEDPEGEDANDVENDAEKEPSPEVKDKTVDDEEATKPARTTLVIESPESAVSMDSHLEATYESQSYQERSMSRTDTDLPPVLVYSENSEYSTTIPGVEGNVRVLFEDIHVFIFVPED